jgi:pyrroloquinoline quinone (PQQ) biosynthesis protein C
MLAQPPLTPGEPSVPPMKGTDYVRHLDETYWEKCPSLPAFYQKLVDGRLKKADLQVWVKDLYPYWDSTLYYSTGAAFVKTNHEPTRTNILRKLVDIEGKEVVNDINGWTTPAYEELWLRLGDGLGVSRDEVNPWKPFTRSHFANEVLRTLSRWWEWSWLDCVASMYAGDRYLREWAAPVKQALAAKYDVPQQSLAFFDAVLGDVDAHLTWESSTLEYWACTTERQLTAARALRTRLDLEDQLLYAIDKASAGEWLFQVP